RPWVGIEVLAVVLDGVGDVLGAAAGVGVGGPGCGLGGVERLAQNDLVLAVQVLDGRAAGVPDEGVAGGPGEGADVLALELPGERAVAAGAGFRIADLFGRADHDGLAALAGVAEAVALGAGEHGA